MSALFLYKIRFHNIFLGAQLESVCRRWQLSTRSRWGSLSANSKPTGLGQLLPIIFRKPWGRDWHLGQHWHNKANTEALKRNRRNKWQLLVVAFSTVEHENVLTYLLPHMYSGRKVEKFRKKKKRNSGSSSVERKVCPINQIYTMIGGGFELSQATSSRSQPLSADWSVTRPTYWFGAAFAWLGQREWQLVQAHSDWKRK